LVEDDKPRERSNAQSKGALSDAELIAILLVLGANESAVDLSKGF
jgi:DNA repair protein RadC